MFTCNLLKITNPCLQGIRRFLKALIFYFYNTMSENDKVELNRIAEVLFELKISQTELAERLGKRKQVINRYCKNTGQPTLSFLREIALALGVNVQELLVPTPTLWKENKD